MKISPLSKMLQVLFRILRLKRFMVDSGRYFNTPDMDRQTFFSVSSGKKRSRRHWGRRLLFYQIREKQDYFSSFSTACAAARRAMGTRKGEQET
ncbi:MAG: hypothetical protein A2X84_00610 [Desulfuromonadaceae bacterium GWC2_58_13]|nr:MAG: hypothetical protein A2X84_00610 [Desulfuromonadaceae bacterium GWC2_58_13]